MDAKHGRVASLIAFSRIDRLPLSAAGLTGERKGVAMHKPGEAADAARRFETRETFPDLSSSREPLPPGAYEGAALARARDRAATISPWLFVMATALNTTVGSVLAVIITLGVVNQDRSNAEVQNAGAAGQFAGIGVAGAGREAPSAGVSLQPITLLPVGAPDRPLRLEPQRPGPFPLQIKGGAGEPFILALSGAPAGTILFGANRISSDTWFLPPGVGSRLEIVLPEWSTSVFEITVALRRTNGAIAAQTKAWIAVPPPAGAAPAAPPADEAAARSLTAKADRLIAKGDIVGARALYQRATELGSGSAALALGATYDPNRLWSLGVLGLAGNKERARQWYQRASELGNAEAKARVTALGF